MANKTTKRPEPKTLAEIGEYASRIDAFGLDRYGLPEPITGIYFLFYKNEVVYVGKSRNVFSRIHAHRVSKQFDSYSFFGCSDEELDIMERIFINKYTPIYNRDALTEKIKTDLLQIVG